MFEFGDCLGRRMHRDRRGRGELVLQPLERVGDEAVEAVARGAPHLFVAEISGEQARSAGIKDHEVKSQFRQPLVQHPGKHRGGAIRCSGGQTPPGRLRVAPVQTDIARRQRGVAEGNGFLEPLNQGRSRVLAQVLREGGCVIDPMAVGIDYGMAQPGANRCGFTDGRHFCSSDL